MPDSTAFPVRRAAISEMAEAVSRRQTLFLASPAAGKLPDTLAVWSRMLVTLVALILQKVLLVTSLSQNLYEAHWRFSGLRVTWVNYLGFYSFFLLGGVALVLLGKECQSTGTRSVRRVNAAVMVLGLSFIFLTLHNGDKNYLYPILSGVLKWDCLGPYVANSLFFNQPFLAGWLIVYAAIYYVLARTGRESRVLFLTAVLGCAYGLIYLQDLLFLRNELLVIDCVGLISVLAITRWNVRAQLQPADGPPPHIRGYAGSHLSLRWLLVPLAWIGFFFWALMRFDPEWQTYRARYFLGLLTLTVILFGAATLWVRNFGRSQLWSWLLAFFVVGFFLLTDSNYPSAKNYNHLLCLAVTFPRYSMGALSVLVGLGLVGLLYRKLRPGAGLWWLDLAALGLIVLAGIDLRLSQIMGVRLGWDVLSFGDSPKMMLRMAKPYLPGLILGLVVMVSLYALAVRWLGNLMSAEPSRAETDGAKSLSNWGGIRLTSAATGWLAALFVCLGVLGIAVAESDKAEAQSALRLVRTSPLWKRISRRTLNRDQFLSTAKSLGLGDLSLAHGAVPAQPRRDLNVLVVFMESSYNKYLSLFGSSDETQPLLSKYKDRMELFPNFFSVFAGSIYARFATFTSLYPTTDFHAFTQERVPVKSLFEVLHDQGYTCSMFYSSYFDYTGFRDFLKNRGFDELYDADTMPGQRKAERVEWGLLEEETLGAIRHQIEKYAQSHQRFCLTYVPAAPHYPYDKVPQPFRKYQLTDINDFKPRYLNELLYMDWVLASIIDELKDSGLLDQTLVVITNDHGEMLGGPDGHIGHGWAMTPALANTPLILMDPQRRGFQINKTIGTQVDVLPTVLDRLNIPVPADQLYEGLSLDAGATRAGRLGYLNSLKEFGIIDGDQVLLGDRESDEPTGPAAQGLAYTISNEGAKTLFTEAEGEGKLQDRKSLMARFDAFQENLLHNYDLYCKSVRGTIQQQAKNSK